MLTLHLEAPSHFELVRKAAAALGLVLHDTTLPFPVPAEAPAPQQEHLSAPNLGYQNKFDYPGDAPTSEAPIRAEVVKEPPRKGRKPGRKPQNPPAGADAVPAAQPEVANTGSAQAVHAPQSDGATTAAGATPPAEAATTASAADAVSAPEPNRPSGQSPVPAAELETARAAMAAEGAPKSVSLEDVRAAGQKVMEKHGIKRVTEILLKETGKTRMSVAHAEGHGAKVIAAFAAAVA